MRVLLAGATGVIGRIVAPRLVHDGHIVYGTTRHEDRLASITATGATALVMDALDTASVSAAVHRAEPDVILHQLTDLASLDFGGNTRLRIEGTRRLVDAAAGIGVSRMIAESISWVMPPGTGAASEDEPLATNATPGVRELEEIVATLHDGVVLRNGALYGPGTWYANDGRLATVARAGNLAATARVSSFVHVEDAAAAVVDAIGWPAGVYNIVDDEPADAADWIPLFAAAVGASASDGATPTGATPTGLADLPAGRAISNAKARAMGWRPRYPSWRTGFRTLRDGDAALR